MPDIIFPSSTDIACLDAACMQLGTAQRWKVMSEVGATGKYSELLGAETGAIIVRGTATKAEIEAEMTAQAPVVAAEQARRKKEAAYLEAYTRSEVEEALLENAAGKPAKLTALLVKRAQVRGES
jgi:hypothetical protein